MMQGDFLKLFSKKGKNIKLFTVVFSPMFCGDTEGDWSNSEEILRVLLDVFNLDNSVFDKNEGL